MRFHAILCTRDEDDIIEQSIKGLLAWADSVFVFDNGSVDKTWEIVQDLAGSDSRVKPVASEPVWFSDQLRGHVFNLIRPQIDHGDWIVRTDSDEFYHIPPPEFVANHIANHETCVYHQYFDFKLTATEVSNLSKPGAIAEERLKPIAERRNFYIPSEYSEPRMCRYRRNISWPVDFTFPKNAGYVSSKRIPIRHYPNRDPQQMFKRVLLRQTMIEANQNGGLFANEHHWRENDWRKHVVMDSDPNLRNWRPGQQLVVPNWTNHLSTGPKRILQRALHGFALPLADWIQARRSVTPYQLTPINDEIQASLVAALANASESQL